MIELEAERIASLGSKTGRAELLKCMGLDLDFGYDEKLRSEIHTNLLYNAFSIAVSKGFSWKDVCKAVELTESLLQNLVGKSLLEATRTYQNEAVKCGMDNRNLAVFTDFFFSTFMQHFKLYQYVFTTTRDERRFVSSVAVEPPIPPDDLINSKPPNLHEYEHNLQRIQAKKIEPKEIGQYPDTEIKVDVEKSDQAEAIEKIISQVVSNIGQPILEDITQAIVTTYQDLALKVEETALPRPKQLGPPPRYQLKPVLQAPKPTAPVKMSGSAKGDRKKSAKAK